MLCQPGAAEALEASWQFSFFLWRGRGGPGGGSLKENMGTLSPRLAKKAAVSL